MSAIREIMNARRAETPATPKSAVTANPEAPTLLVEASKKEMWLLPWQHLLCACYLNDAGEERLTLTFITHEVIVCGRNFGTLVEALAFFRIGAVRSDPGKYSESSGSDPFVVSVEMRAIKEEPMRGRHNG